MWDRIGNRCLELAVELLRKETTPTAATVEAVKRLVDTAIAIDSLNLRWYVRTRSAGAVFRGQPFSRPEEEN